MKEEAGKVIGATLGITLTSLVFPFTDSFNMGPVVLLIVCSATLGGVIGKTIGGLLPQKKTKKRSTTKRVQGNARGYAYIKRLFSALHGNFNNLVAFIKKSTRQAFNLVTKN